MICSKRFIKSFLFIGPVPPLQLFFRKAIGRRFLEEQAPWSCRTKKIVGFRTEVRNRHRVLDGGSATRDRPFRKCARCKMAPPGWVLPKCGTNWG
jgi:hypothetical protein